MLSFEGIRFTIEVRCSKGTYIRTLVEDIGRHLGSAAHITALRRIGVGPFTDGMVSLDDLARLAEQGTAGLDDRLLPVDAAIGSLPEMILQETVARYLGQGQAVMVPHAPVAGLLRVYDENRRFLGVAEVQDDGRLAPKRLVNAVN